MSVLQGKTADGKPLFGVMDSQTYQTFSDRSSFPWLLELHIAMKETTEDGLPAGDELATVDRFADELVAALSRATTVHRIGHLTGDGLREVYCYLSEQDIAHAFLSAVIQQQHVRDFEYRITKDPTWELAAEWGL